MQQCDNTIARQALVCLDSIGKDQLTSAAVEARFRLAKCLRACVVVLMVSTSRADVETLGGSRSASFCFDQDNPPHFDVEYSLRHSWPVERGSEISCYFCQTRPAFVS